MKLWELPSEMAEVERIISEDPDADESLMELLNGLKMEFADKIEWLAKAIRNDSAEEDAYKAEAKFFTEKARFAAKRAHSRKRFIHMLMNAVGVKKVDGQHLKIAIQKNPPSVDVVDESLIPKAFWVPQDPVLDRKAILSALKDGDIVDGCRVKQGESIRIR